MLRDILERQRRTGFAGIAGATIKGRIPVRESLINDAVQDAMRETRGSSNSFTLHRIAIRDNNIVVVNATVKKWLFTRTLNLGLALDSILDFPRDPVFRLRPARSLGLIGLVIEIFSAAFPLPDYVTFAGQTLAIDLKRAMERASFADLVPIVQYVGFITEPGVLNVDFHLAVAPTPVAPRLPATNTP